MIVFTLNKVVILFILFCSFCLNAHSQNITSLVGAISGNYEISSSGSATYSIPISLPPGTAGFTPQLSLDYDSSAAGNYIGPGWHLSFFQTISRCPAVKPLDGYISGIAFSQNDRFCLNGQRLLAVSGAYGQDGTVYRTALDTFSRITSYGRNGNGPAYFKVELKSGEILEFGNSTDSLLRGASQRVLAWNLNKFQDRLGNYYNITYYSESWRGFSVPAFINYSGNISAGLQPYNQVAFEYENLTWPKQQYVAGDLFGAYLRLKSIKIRVSNNLVRLYSLAYHDSDRLTFEDRLISIRECDANLNCLAPTTFTWGEIPSNGLEFVAAQSYNNLARGYGYGPNYSHPIFVSESNGDGISDLIRVNGGATVSCLNTFSVGFGNCELLNDFGQNSYPETNSRPMVLGDWKGTGRLGPARSDGSKIISYSPSSDGRSYVRLNDLNAFASPHGYNDQVRDPLFVGDWNADGRTDLARGHLGSNTFVVSHALSNGNGFELQASQLSISNPNNYLPFVFTGDWDADGRADFAVTWEDRPAASNQLHFYRSNGSSFEHFVTIPQPILGPSNPSFSSDDYPIVTGDWNADGISDFAVVGSLGVKFYRGTGVGFVLWHELLDLGRDQVAGDANRYPIEVGDWNSDGSADIARVTSSEVRFYVSSSRGMTLLNSLSNLSPAQGYSTNQDNQFLVGDWNGDGFSDVARLSHNAVVQFNKVSTDSNYIKTINNGMGMIVSFDYAQMVNPALYAKGQSSVYPFVDVGAAMRLVSYAHKSNGIGSLSSYSFSYSGLVFDHQYRQRLGFASINVRDLQSGVLLKTFYKQQYPYFGLVYKKEERLASGTLVSLKEEIWDNMQTAPGVVFPFVSSSRDAHYDINSSVIQNTQAAYSYDIFGNILEATTTNHDGASVRSLSTYNNDSNTWLIGQLASSQVTKVGAGPNPPAAITRSTSFEYLPVSGLLRAEIIEPNNPIFRHTKTYAYDSFGNLATTTISGSDFETRVTRKFYDQRGQFEILSTNALGHMTYFERDPRNGLVTKVTDPNGLIVEAAYDAFGRSIREARADGTSTQIFYLAADALSPSHTAYIVRKESSATVPTIVYYDSLNREIRQETVAFNGQRLLSDKLYNHKGQLARVSEPYFAGSAALWTVNTYDDLGRIEEVLAPGNVQTGYIYSGLRSSVVNSLGQIKTENSNSLGQVVSATDNLGQTVNFKYDSYGNLIKITDQLGNVTDIQFDLAGRKTLVVDPNTGSTSYTYDQLGQTLSQTNANQQTIRFSYDKLGRMLTKSSSAGQEMWVYDLGFKAIGKLSELVGLKGFREVYEYDNLSRLVRTATTIAEKQYDFSHSYDRHGRLDVVTYPSGFAIQHQYNSAGYLSAIHKLSDQALIWRAEVKNARGQIERQALGNSLTQSFEYEISNGLMRRISVPTVQDLSFSFDVLGNLVQRKDLRAGTQEDFLYDEINRLRWSRVIGQPAVTIVYNAIGNITGKSDVGIYLYGQNSAGPQAVTQIVGLKSDSYRYDAAGNRIASSSGTISYSPTGKPVSISKGSNTLQFDLDPRDQRFEERTLFNNTPVERKVFVGAGLYEQVIDSNGVTDVNYVRSPTGLVAVFKKLNAKRLPASRSAKAAFSSSNYFLLDHLGSVQTVTDSAGVVLEVLSYDSWGNRRNPLTWAAANSRIGSLVDRGFTGHEHLDRVSLIHMNGRVYDPVIARFISPDPFVQTLNDLQSHNRYSYLNNNPLGGTDPSGYFFKRIGRFLRKAIPIAASVIAAYYGGAFIGQYFGGPLGAFLSGAGAGASGGMAGSLASGRGFGNSLSAAYQGGIRGLLDFTIGCVFPGWNEFITGVNAKPGQLQILRAEWAVAKQLGRVAAQGLSQGALAYAFGGNFNQGFVGGLGTSSFVWGVNVFTENAFKTEWESRSRGGLKELHGVLDTPEKLTDFLRNIGVSSQTAKYAATGDQTKSVLGMSVFDWRVNNHGIEGSASLLTGEGGAVNNFIGMYIPGQQSVSVAHDFLVGAFQRSVAGGPGFLTSTFSTLTIPPAVLAGQWSTGYWERSMQLHLQWR